MTCRYHCCRMNAEQLSATLDQIGLTKWQLIPSWAYPRS